jgi:hypothetical protein
MFLKILLQSTAGYCSLTYPIQFSFQYFYKSLKKIIISFQNRLYFSAGFALMGFFNRKTFFKANCYSEKMAKTLYVFNLNNNENGRSQIRSSFFLNENVNEGKMLTFSVTKIIVQHFVKALFLFEDFLLTGNIIKDYLFHLHHLAYKYLQRSNP